MQGTTYIKPNRIMANYLLLRNNKESGPYSLEDLTDLGLKAYDLVWVQGKSAAWRYPSEIEELKPFAPSVEEQPFDRFYKKTTSDTEIRKPEVKRQEIPVAEVKYEQPVVESPYEQPITEPQYEKYIPKKSVAITLPGQKSTAIQPTVKTVQAPVKEQIPEPIPAQPTISISENPAAAQIKYSQPLDEIKEMYVKTLYDRKQKIARKTFWLQSAKKAAVVLALVAAGVIAGFIMRPGKGNQNNQAATIAQVEKPVQPVTSKTEPSVSLPDTTTLSNNLVSSNNSQPIESDPAPLHHQPTGGYVNKMPELREKPNSKPPSGLTVHNNRKEADQPASAENKLNASAFAPESVETNPSTGERSRKVRSASSEMIYNQNDKGNTGAPEKKTSVPNDIAGLVTVKSNEYKRVAFGGIRDLQLTVVNDSKFILDNVTVELQYIKPNELPLKTENIQFTSIAPNATSTVRVPDTNRGIKVVFRITHIKKKQGDERVADN